MKIIIIAIASCFFSFTVFAQSQEDPNDRYAIYKKSITSEVFVVFVNKLDTPRTEYTVSYNGADIKVYQDFVVIEPHKTSSVLVIRKEQLIYVGTVKFDK